MMENQDFEETILLQVKVKHISKNTMCHEVAFNKTFQRHINENPEFAEAFFNEMICYLKNHAKSHECGEEK